MFYVHILALFVALYFVEFCDQVFIPLFDSSFYLYGSYVMRIKYLLFCYSIIILNTSQSDFL